MLAGLGRSELTSLDRVQWLSGFRTLVSACPELGMPDGYARLMNVKHTVRALYFLVHNEKEPWSTTVTNEIVELLSGFSEL